MAATVHQRKKWLFSLEKFLEGPMILLGFVWLILLVIDFIKGLSPTLNIISIGIWLLFIINFIVKFILAPAKLAFLKTNWLEAISLLIPALRIFRLFRFLKLFQSLRGTSLIRIVSTINRGMKSLAATMKRHAFGYIIILTLIVLFAGAAGMYAFENSQGVLKNYSTAVWWTAMLIITIGSDYWPVTPEGRILCFMISIYGFAVFGYVTATLASYFIGRDADDKEAPVAGAKDVQELKTQIEKLTQAIEELKTNRRV